MAHVLLFHHAHGLTAGVRAFADELRAAGHTVAAPDLFDGHTFARLDDGLAHVGALGVGEILARGRRAAEHVPAALVYAGFSLGVLPAQALAMTRPGARGALFFHACVPPAALGAPWPAGLPAQVHVMDADPIATTEGDLAAARALAAADPRATLFVYPGAAHLFADASLPSYDPGAAALLTRRALEFLGQI